MPKPKQSEATIVVAWSGASTTWPAAGHDHHHGHDFEQLVRKVVHQMVDGELDVMFESDRADIEAAIVTDKSPEELRTYHEHMLASKREAIERALALANNSRTRAAELLGVSRTSFHNLVKKLEKNGVSIEPKRADLVRAKSAEANA